MTVHPAWQISLGTRPVWSESSLCTHWVAKDPSFLHVNSEGSAQTGRMPRLIWNFTVCTCHFVGFVMRWLKYCLHQYFINIMYMLGEYLEVVLWFHRKMIYLQTQIFISVSLYWFCTLMPALGLKSFKPYPKNAWQTVVPRELWLSSVAWYHSRQTRCHHFRQSTSHQLSYQMPDTTYHSSWQHCRMFHDSMWNHRLKYRKSPKNSHPKNLR